MGLSKSFQCDEGRIHFSLCFARVGCLHVKPRKGRQFTLPILFSGIVAVQEHVWMWMCTPVYDYIYIPRERERERDKGLYMFVLCAHASTAAP